MDFQLVAEVLWAAFVGSLFLTGVGLIATHHRQQTLAVGLLVFAALVLLGFSVVAGFSIGRLTMVIPVLIAGYLVGLGGARLQVAEGLLAALVLYVVCSWFLTPFLPDSPLMFPFAFWGAPIYLVFLIGASAWSLLHPRSRPN